MIALLLAVARAAEPPTDEVLGEGFPFCTEAGRGGPEVLRLCPLLEGLPEDRCPGLRQTCAGETPPPQESAGCNQPPGGSGDPDGIAGAPEAPPQELPELDLGDWAEWLGAVTRWGAAFLVAALVLLLLRVAWRTFARPAAAPGPAPAAPVVADEPTVEELPVAPVADVLSAARAALAAGRYDEVVALARGASLKHLAETGRLALHRARTDREYVRAARRAGADGDLLRTVTAAREASLFGRRPVDEGVARAVLAAAERLVAAAALVCFAVGASDAHAGDPRYGPSGDAALPLVLQAWGHTVTWRLRSLDDLSAETDVLVLDLAAVGPTDEQLLHVREWVEGGGVLWVAGAPSVGFDELGPIDVGPCQPEIDPGFGALDTPQTSRPEGPVWALAPSPIVWCSAGGAAAQVLHLGEGVVVAFADDEWLLNGAFVDPGTERFVGDLLHVGRVVDAWPTNDPPHVELATLASTRAPSDGSNNPFRSVANARLLPFVLQLLLAGAVLGAWRGWPFSPLRAPEEDGRRRFSEHVRALGTRLSRGRASGVAARSLARYWHARLGAAGLVLAAQRAGLSREAAAAFAREVEARAGGEGARSASDHEFMEELWSITRGRAH